MVLTVMECEEHGEMEDHEVDTNSGEATATCGAVTVVGFWELIDLLKD